MPDRVPALKIWKCVLSAGRKSSRSSICTSPATSNTPVTTSLVKLIRCCGNICWPGLETRQLTFGINLLFLYVLEPKFSYKLACFLKWSPFSTPLILAKWSNRLHKIRPGFRISKYLNVRQHIDVRKLHKSEMHYYWAPAFVFMDFMISCDFF